MSKDDSEEIKELAFLIHEELRERDMLLLIDPRDNVPYCATATAHRNHLDYAAEAIWHRLEKWKRENK